MNFLETILNDLDKQDIYFDEHYDPGGMQLYVMHVRDYANPTLIYSEFNPHQVYLSIFIIYSPPNLFELEEDEKFRRELTLKELGLEIGLLHKIGIHMNVFHASIGIVLNKNTYDKYKLMAGLKVVTRAYDRFIKRAIEILHRD